MKRIALAAVLILGSTLNAAADWDTLYFVDMQKPRGQERSDEARNADLLVCGSPSNFELDKDLIPAVVRCMRKHGWRVAQTKHTHTWIDPDTSGTCYNGSYMGIPSVQCTPGDHSN
ncbi:MAG: hypothetical protein P4L98_20265 [Ancalomicrobiaceae bacterium]|nr:hypothetical protein [Ancalomicrobiaceae bacterium]